jgi:predicted RNase H-like HicB family nuclease
MKDIYAFPATLSYEEDGITIEFPDLPGCLPCAATTEEAVKNAKEALGLHLWGMERDDDEIPNPTDISALHLEQNEIPLMVDVFMPPIRERQSNRFVKKTLSIPSWLNAEAEHAGVNFSQILQISLKQHLGYAQ